MTPDPGGGPGSGCCLANLRSSDPTFDLWADPHMWDPGGGNTGPTDSAFPEPGDVCFQEIKGKLKGHQRDERDQLPVFAGEAAPEANANRELVCLRRRRWFCPDGSGRPRTVSVSASPTVKTNNREFGRYSDPVPGSRKQPVKARKTEPNRRSGG